MAETGGLQSVERYDFFIRHAANERDDQWDRV
jgi:hypothetical protein